MVAVAEVAEVAEVAWNAILISNYLNKAHAPAYNIMSSTKFLFRLAGVVCAARYNDTVCGIRIVS